MHITEKDFQNATGKSFGQKSGVTQNSLKSKKSKVGQQAKKHEDSRANQQGSASKSPSKSQLAKGFIQSSTTLKQEDANVVEDNRASKSAIAKQPIFSKFEQTILKSSVSKNNNNPVSSTTVVAVKQNVIERGLSTQERDNTPIQTGTKEGDLDKKSS